jgi:NSS family neurotransmitter:Na+ symporter
VNQNREQWGSRLGFILAAAGSAIGLGNIWMFPKTAGENGGGLFVLLYLLCVMVIGVPLMLAELAIGRASQSNAVGAFKKLTPGKPWFLTGGLGVLAGFLILSFYAVIGGWILIYLWDSITGLLTSQGMNTLTALNEHFTNRTTDPMYSILFYFIFMALTIFIVYKGIGEGIEKWSKILMPVLLGLLVLVIVRGLFLEGAMKGLEFLFVPRFEDFKPETLAGALSQAFFSLSLGMGAMITYGSYLKKNQNLPQSAVQVGGLDTLIGILAGMAIFPALLSINPDISPADMGGSGLIFKAFPQIFLEMFGGNALFAQIFAILFFVLVLIAALTSSISLLEVVTAYFVDERKFKRSHAAMIMGALIFIIGIPSALPTGAFDIVSSVTYDYMLPIGGFFISIYASWVWGRNRALIEIADGCKCFKLGILWHFILRWIAPFVIFQILLGKILIDLKVSESIRTTLQTVFTYTDAVLIGGALIAGIYFWFFKPASLVRDEKE